MEYDSTTDTLKHIMVVSSLVNQIIHRLIIRAEDHDNSKLYPPEKEIFDEYTPKLKETTYGSDEYKQYLSEMQVALFHHYKTNTHHPEHFKNGVNDMNLIDIVEMLCDWKAATLRHDDGDIYKSIEINTKRFGLSEQLAQILKNTLTFLKW